MTFHSIRGSGGNPFNPAPSSPGGGGKYGSQGVESDNTLRSAAFARVVELLSEGPIQGLVQGGTSIYFNKTPVVNANATVNFRGVQWESRSGLPDQVALPGNATSSTRIQVGIQVQNQVSPPVITIEDPTVTSAQVIVSVPALYSQDDNGNIVPTSVAWHIDVQPAGGGWQTVGNVNLGNQKCTSLYQHASTFTLPAGGAPWNIRVVRDTADSFTTNLANQTWWDSYTEIIAGNFIYPNSALIGLTIDSELFSSSSIPNRAYHVQGLIIQVPSNYDPITRTYTGVWNGTFKSAYCNNPAWVFYDILTNSRYGIGDFIDATKVDKWGLYTIAQYCDQLVPDGYGGYEPRYTFNGVLNNRQEAWKAIQSITSCFRGMSYWSTGQVFASADMPEDPVKLVTPANVIEGHFSYSGTGLKSRHSVALVRWNDPVTLYAPTVEVVVNDAQLLKFGWRETNITAVGCTSRGQANRMGKWILDTEQYATETVEYVCSWDHVNIRPGNIISIADPNKNQVRLGGRLIGATQHLVITDQAFVPVQGETYNILFELSDGTIATYPVASFSGRNVNVTGTITFEPNVGAMFVLTGSQVEPRKYRVLSIQETDKHLFKVTALFYDPSKYERVENGISLPIIPYSQPKSTINPPANLSINETVHYANGVAHNRLTLSWTPSDDFMASKYLILGKSPNGGAVESIGSSSGMSYDIDDPGLGVWTFYVQSVGIDGRTSTYISMQFDVQGWAAMAAPYISHLEIYGQAGDDDFVGTDCHLDWNNNFPGSTTDVGQEKVVGAGSFSPFYRDNIITIIDVNTQQTLRQEIIHTDDYIYTIDKNTSDNSLFNRGPRREFEVQVQVQDTLGRISAPDNLVVSNPAPEIIFPGLSSAAGNIYVVWQNPVDPDFVGAIVWVSLDPNFNPMTTAPAYQGSNNFFVFPGIIGSTYYVRIAGYDSFGTSGLNISPSQRIICSGFGENTLPPAVPTNLALSAGTTTATTGEVVPTLTGIWDASPSDNFAYFEIAIEQQGGSYISNQTALNNYTFANGLVAMQTYIVKVRAWSTYGYSSDWCLPISLTMPAKTTAPGAAANFGIAASLRAAYLTWTNPSDPDLDHVEVWQNANSTLASAALIGSSYGTGYTVSGLTTGATYYFWLRTVNTSGVAGAYVGPIPVTMPAAITSDIALLAIDGSRIAAGAITDTQVSPGTLTSASIAAQTIVANNIATGTITSNQIAGATIIGSNIAGGTITGDKIQAGAISTAQFDIHAQLPVTMTIGSSGVSIGTVQTNAATGAQDPAVRINAGTTTIGAGFIQLSGATTLSSWQSGSDATKINGGTIQANTIQANSLSIGNRGVHFSGFAFNVNSDTSTSWSAGSISYVNDAGTVVSLSIPSGQTGVSGGSAYYIAWTKDQTGLAASYTPFNSINTITIAIYSPGSGLVVNYGGTQIDGSNISTGSIQAAQIAAGTITADKIAAGVISADQISAGSITGDEIAANTITANNIQAATITATQLAAGAITATQLAAGAITATQIAVGAVGSSQLASGAVGSSKLASGAALANIDPSTITGTYIANGTILTANLAAGAVTVGKMNVATLSGITANIGVVNAGTINSTTLLNDGVTPVMTINLNAGTLTISDNS